MQNIVDRSYAPRRAENRMVRRRRLGAGISGTVLALALAAPQAAHAQSDCGGPIDGLIYCGPAPDNYKDGIEYISDPATPSQLITIIEPGTVIAAKDHNGIFISNLNGSLAISASDTTIATSGDFAAGIVGHVNAGSVAILAGDVTTTGDYSAGIIGVAGAPNDPNLPTGAVVVTAGTVATNGFRSYGIDALAHGGQDSSIYIGAGSVLTTGDESIGISAQGDYGTILVRAGSVATTGDAATGIYTYASTAGGRSYVEVDSVTTSGNAAAGIHSAGYGSSTIHANGVTTSGDQSAGIVADSIVGATEVHAGSVRTSGAESSAILSRNYYGNIVIAAESVSTGGDSSLGIYASDRSGDVHVTAGIVKTAGTYSTGVAVRSVHGRADVHAGNIETTGYGSTGLLMVTGKDAAVSVDQVTTTGDFSVGMLVWSGQPYLPSSTSVTINAGSVTTSGFGSVGINALSIGGSTTVNAGLVETKGDYASGILFSVHGGDAVLNVDHLSTHGNKANGIYGHAYGSVTVEVGEGSTAGDYSAVVRTRTSAHGTNTITLSGDTTTSGKFSQAIFSYSIGGDTVIDNQGTIRTTGEYSHGIISNVLSGEAIINAGIIVTTGDRSGGVKAFAPGGYDGSTKAAITITADSIATSGANANGITAENPGDGVIGFSLPVDLIRAATAGQANQLISIKSGAITVSGSGSHGIFVEGVGKVDIDAGTTKAFDGNAIHVGTINDVTVRLRGATTSAKGDAVVLGGNDVTLSVDAGGSVAGGVNGVVIDGPPPPKPTGPGGSVGLFDIAFGKAVVNNAGTISGGSGFALQFNAGAATINNSGRIVGAVRLTQFDDVISNSGSFEATKDSDFGQGNDLFTNTGTVRLTASIATNVTFLGLEKFDNKGGLVDLRNGHAGDVFTLPGDYVGSGKASLALDINGASADSFVVNGAATGKTNVVLSNLGASGATLTGAKPIILIKVGAGSAADAFSMSPSNVGFIQYGLTYDAASRSFGLVGGAGSAVYRSLKIGEGAQAVSSMSADAWTSHMAELRNGAGPERRLWGQLFGQVETRDEVRDVAVTGGTAQHYNLGYKQDYYGVQLGYDLGNGGAVGWGLTGGYIGSKLRYAGAAETVNYDVLNLGGYAGYKEGIFFVNALVKYDHYWVKADSLGLGYSDKFHGDGYSAHVEAGLRLGSDAFYAEPVASVAWLKTDLGDLRALGQSLDFDSATGLRGKLGARIGGSHKLGSGPTIAFYAGGSVIHEFEGVDGVTLVSGGTFEHVGNARIKTYGQGLLGLNIFSDGPVSGFIEGNGNFGGAYKGGGGRVGLRIRL
ncbi:MAG: putative secreted protein [Bradyrhizobium sp.]|nr:putative secreted protein [Bradyrhizobium sp.]